MSTAVETTLNFQNYDDEVQQFLAQMCSMGHKYVFNLAIGCSYFLINNNYVYI